VPRRATIQPRPLEPDPVHSSRLVAQVINKVMTDGKKSTAESIVYRALDRVGEQTGKPPVEVLEQAGSRAAMRIFSFDAGGQLRYHPPPVGRGGAPFASLCCVRP